MLSDQSTLHRKMSLDEFLHHRRQTPPTHPPSPKGCSGMIQIQYGNKKVRRYPLRNPQRTPKYQLTYCQVVIPITFQDNNTTFYLTASCVVGAGPCTLSSVGDNQATPELNETAKDTPKSATPTALEFKNFSLNLTLTTGLGVQELTVKTDSDITPAGSFGVNDNDLTYLGLIEDSPEIKNTNSDLSALIKETGNIH